MNEDFSIKEKINSQIDIDKEILSVLPKNNKKNLQTYKDKAAEIKHEYNTYLDEILSEMKRRMVKIKSIVPDPKIEKLNQEIQYMDKIELLNQNITSFEKMGLDETLYVLRRFYKNNLELINDAIVRCLEKFRIVGINLTAEDFEYSIYTKEYMSTFLEEMKKGDCNSGRVKDLFEQIYWKCPDIIIHIELNFRSLYLKNEKKIDKYYEDAKKQITKELGLTEIEAIQKYEALQSQLIETKNKDTALIIEKFLSGEANTKDYEFSSIKKNYKKLLGKDYEEFDKEQIDEINKNISRLQNSLYEYKNYLRFKFIYDSVVQILNSKEKYRTTYIQKLKQIKKAEVVVFKNNKKIRKFEKHKGFIQKIFGKSTNRLEKINLDANTQIIELRNIYRDLQENKIKNIISSVLNDGSTIYDALFLVCHFYSFLVNSMIDEFPDIMQDDMYDTIEKFRRFIKYPKITIINNVKMLEDKDLALMIKDKYNLCNINIKKEDLEEDNVSNLITIVNNICGYNYIVNSKTTLKDIQFVLQAKKILEENQK